MRKILKYASTILIVTLIVIQFIRPERNFSGDETKHVSTVFPVSNEVNSILQNSCNDCHSNKTVYPWYTNIQPVGLWMTNHVNEGKQKINFSEFASYKPRRQYHKMEDLVEVIEEDEMPLPSYTFIHRNAVLNAEQKQTLLAWAKGIEDTLKTHYPMDSLIFKKR